MTENTETTASRREEYARLVDACGNWVAYLHSEYPEEAARWGARGLFRPYPGNGDGLDRVMLTPGGVKYRRVLEESLPEGVADEVLAEYRANSVPLA